jgi:hypothetical protein
MKNMTRLLYLLLLTTLLVGCVSTKYVERKQYLLNQGSDLVKKNCGIKLGCSIFIEKVIGSAPFDQTDFFYRVGSDRYLVDYYNGFMVSPREQLDSILRTQLRSLSKCDLGGLDSAKPINVLQVRLIELYADYRDRTNPTGVVSIQFRLTSKQDNKEIVLLDRVFGAVQPLKAKDTASLLNAWDIGIKDILKEAIKVLNQKALIQ